MRRVETQQRHARLRERANGSARTQVSHAQRTRIVSAMVQLACDQGVESATATKVIRLARVSRRTFYELFEDRDDCLAGAIEDAVALVADRARAAYSNEARWVDRVHAGLLAVLQFFDEEPELARLCVVQALAADTATLTRRGEVLDQLALVIDEGRNARRPPCRPLPLAAEGVVCGVLGVIHARLLQQDPSPLVDLVSPLMGMIALPYLGTAAAQRQLSRPTRDGSSPPRKEHSVRDPLEGLNMRVTYRTLRVLEVIADDPGMSNRAVAQASGISDQGQISKLLIRLRKLGLVRNTGKGQSKGAPNAWTLTAEGQAILRALKLGSGQSRSPG
jgi:AcrR family transcriptional regulator